MSKNKPKSKKNTQQKTNTDNLVNVSNNNMLNKFSDFYSNHKQSIPFVLLVFFLGAVILKLIDSTQVIIYLISFLIIWNIYTFISGLIKNLKEIYRVLIYIAMILPSFFFIFKH